jgi:hypothetical protein
MQLLARGGPRQDRGFLDQMGPDAADEQTTRVRPGRMSTDGGRIVEQTQSCPCVEDAVAITGQWGGA